MPFDEDNDDDNVINKKSLKTVSSQRSILEKLPKKITQEDFESKVNKMQENASAYKKLAAEYSIQFKNIFNDKTLKQNKNIFTTEIEIELLSNMIKLASDINTDPDEQEGMGSLIWIVLLLKACLSQRDKINDLEYSIAQLEKKIIAQPVLELLIKKEIVEVLEALDKHKSNE